MAPRPQAEDRGVLFRKVNDRIYVLACVVAPDDRWDFLCECGDHGCYRALQLTTAEYEVARALTNGPIVAPSHVGAQPG